MKIVEYIYVRLIYVRLIYVRLIEGSPNNKKIVRFFKIYTHLALFIRYSLSTLVTKRERKRESREREREREKREREREKERVKRGKEKKKETRLKMISHT